MFDGGNTPQDRLTDGDDRLHCFRSHRAGMDMSKPVTHTRNSSWIKSVGFLYVVLTVIPTVVGIHVGSYVHHEATGALLGAVAGQGLAVWIVIRPIWLDADRETKADRQDD